MKHKHLNFEQRYLIECMQKNRHKKKDIYTAIGVAESTLYRELKRNSRPRSYNAKYAHMLAKERLKDGHYKRKFTRTMQKLVEEKLRLDWSPEQIKGWCNKEAIEIVSHEKNYQFVWQDKTDGEHYTNT